MRYRRTFVLKVILYINLESDTEEDKEDNKGMVNLLESGDLADIEVSCGGQTFQCHSAILASKYVIKFSFD